MSAFCVEPGPLAFSEEAMDGFAQRKSAVVLASREKTAPPSFAIESRRILPSSLSAGGDEGARTIAEATGPFAVSTRCKRTST